MKVIYLMTHVSRCGGVKVICEHVAGLAARGRDCELWCLGGDLSWFHRPVPIRVFPNTDALGAELRALTPKCAVSTWWTTHDWVPPNLRPGDKGFSLVQDDDAATYSGVTDGRVYRLGLTLLTESVFVTDLMKQRYGVECVNVGIGIDPKVFRPLPAIRDRTRVLTPYRPLAGGNDLKGWGTASAALRKLAAINPAATLMTFGSDGTPRVDWMPHRHVDSPSDRLLKELYCTCGVFLSASRHEGFGLPAAEAMACEAPVVCTDSGGPREFARHGETAMVSRVGSADDLASQLADVLASESLADRLGGTGRRESLRYRWDGVIDRLESLYFGAGNGT